MKADSSRNGNSGNSGFPEYAEQQEHTRLCGKAFSFFLLMIKDILVLVLNF